MCSLACTNTYNSCYGCCGMAHGISGRVLNGASFDVRVSTATGLMQLLDSSPLHAAPTVTYNLYFALPCEVPTTCLFCIHGEPAWEGSGGTCRSGYRTSGKPRHITV